MTKPLPIDDFRAIRIILEPDDFAHTDGKTDIPTDLIDEETWRHTMMLPDDVSIRTSNHHGKLIHKLNELNSGCYSESCVKDSKGDTIPNVV